MPARHLVRTSIRTGTPRRGAASLVVVMVLFFVLTLVAAYTSRNLIFEQRTSANQYRSTLAFETADAGIEWALARLNEGRMDDTCTQLPNAAAVTSPPQPSFRERYLGAINAATGVITPPADKFAGCVFNGTGWTCHCPNTGNPAPTVVYSGNGPFAAFWVRFQTVSATRPGVVRIQVNACTRAADDCLNFVREAQPGDGLATVWDMVALRSAMVSAPAAALTVRGAFTGPGGGDHPVVTNTDATSGGLTIHSGSTITPLPLTLTLNTIPGSLPQQSFSQNDAALALPDLVIAPATPASDGRNRMFNSVFGMWPATYFAQPALAVVDCSAGCNANDINSAVLLRPGTPVHVTGAGTLSVDADIGTAAAPVLIVADNDVEFSGVHSLYGVVYSRDTEWRLRGDGTIRGAAIAERGFRIDDLATIIYDRDVLLRARYQNGSFAKVPGGWRDFAP